MQYKNLLSPIKIGKRVYKNRVIMGPYMPPHAAENGYPNAVGMAYYEARARGGAAQITIGEHPVDFDRAARRPPETFYNIIEKNPSAIQSRMITELVKTIKQHGAVTSIELSHIGMYNEPQFIKDGKNPIGPTGYIRDDGVTVDEMTEQDMDDVCESFADAAMAAKNYGFDAILVHGGHGWLQSQFLSPRTNHRTDGYGGSLENRAKFPIAVLDRIRERVGDDLIIEYRISGEEVVEGGMELDETIEFIKMIEDKIDLVHISAGIYFEPIKSRMFPSPYERPACNTHLSERVKKAVKIPVAVVGAITDPELAEEIIAEGKADIVVMVKQLIAEPDYVYKLQNNEEPIPCCRCYYCFCGWDTNVLTNCAVNPVAQAEYRLPYMPPRGGRKKVLVAGGGPGGMSAAIYAAENGHEVILAEKSESLGGILKFTDNDSIKRELGNYKNYLIRKVGRMDIDVRLGLEVTPALVEKENPDVLITAVGSSPVIPDIKGIDGENVLQALEVYEESHLLKDSVVIVGGGMVGCETAMHLTLEGKSVTIVEMADSAAADCDRFIRQELLDRMNDMGITINTGQRCVEIRPDGVVTENQEGQKSFIAGESVIHAVGMRAEAAVAGELNRAAKRSFTVGDCVKARKVGHAVGEAYFAAVNI